jgi:hypothetical protein
VPRIGLALVGGFQIMSSAAVAVFETANSSEGTVLRRESHFRGRWPGP